MSTEKKKKTEHKYRLSYKLEPLPDGGITAEEAKARAKDGHGACDAMLVASIIYPEDGSLSIMFAGKDGRTGEDLADVEWFKVWMLLTERLARSETLGEGKRFLCAEIFQMVAQAVMGPRKDGG